MRKRARKWPARIFARRRKKAAAKHGQTLFFAQSQRRQKTGESQAKSRQIPRTSMPARAGKNCRTNLFQSKDEKQEMGSTMGTGMRLAFVLAVLLFAASSSYGAEECDLQTALRYGRVKDAAEKLSKEGITHDEAGTQIAVIGQQALAELAHDPSEQGLAGRFYEEVLLHYQEIEKIQNTVTKQRVLYLYEELSKTIPPESLIGKEGITAIDDKLFKHPAEFADGLRKMFLASKADPQSIDQILEKMSERPQSVEFVKLKPGKFWMGSPASEEHRQNGGNLDETRHEVELTHTIEMAKTPFTKGALASFSEKYAEGEFERKLIHAVQKLNGIIDHYGNFVFDAKNANRPAHTSFYDELVIANMQSRAMGLEAPFDLSGMTVVNADTNPVQVHGAEVILSKTGKLYDAVGMRPAMSAEWEYGARAEGKLQTAYANGRNDVRPDEAHYDPHAQGTTAEVGSYPANEIGLQDMMGNVWEWTYDWSGPYETRGLQIDPTGPTLGSYRVIRGGGWYNVARDLRSAQRYSAGPGFRDVVLGFRLVRTLP